MVKVADNIIDIGPDGGKRGGEIVYAGTPEKLIKNGIGYTAEYLEKEMQ